MITRSSALFSIHPVPFVVEAQVWPVARRVDLIGLPTLQSSRTHELLQPRMDATRTATAPAAYPDLLLIQMSTSDVHI